MSWNDGLEVSSVAYQIASSSEKNIKVLAGPGTGKSFAMKRRVARLLEDGVLPEEILALTFIRVAAGDLDAELRATGVPGAEQLEAQTLHSFALRVLSGSNAIESSGRTPRLLNEYEMAALYCDFESDFGGKKKVKKLLSRFSDAWGHESTAFFAQLEGEDKEFHTQLMNWLDFHQGMLLEELIFLANSFLKMNPNSEDLTRYKHVLADEYQDFNQAEQNLVRQLSCDADICIVGDDDQSIYGFKQANPQGIRDWTADAEFPMQECRRCPTDLVGIANSLIAHNKERQGRKLVGMVENGQGDIKYQQFPNFDD